MALTSAAESLDPLARVSYSRRMKNRVPKNRAVTIPASRWLAYAGAGVATALAGVSRAEGEIHYSGRVDTVFPPDVIKSVQLPLDQQEIRSLSCASRNRRTFSGCVVRRVVHSSVPPALASSTPMSSGSTNGIKTSIFHKALSAAPGWGRRERLGRWSKEIV